MEESPIGKMFAEITAKQKTPETVTPDSELFSINKTDEGYSVLQQNSAEQITVPTNIGTLISIALRQQEKADNGQMETKQMLEKVNCHKSTLYALDLIEFDELVKPRDNTDANSARSYTAKDLSDQDFTIIEDNHNSPRPTTPSVYVGQIADAAGDYIRHSFLLIVDESNNNVVFEKEGYDHGRFQLRSLDNLIDHYRAHYRIAVRFIPQDEINLE